MSFTGFIFLLAVNAAVCLLVFTGSYLILRGLGISVVFRRAD